MEAPEIAHTEIALQHMKEVQQHKGRTYPLSSAVDSTVEYIPTQVAQSLAHPKGRCKHKRFPQSSVLSASALALVASITMVLLWLALCHPSRNKVQGLGLVERRLSHIQDRHTFSNSASSCAVLETNLNALHSASRRVEEPDLTKLWYVPGVDGYSASSPKAAAWSPQASAGIQLWPLQGGGDSSASKHTSDLSELAPSHIARRSLCWTELNTKQLEHAKATTHGTEAMVTGFAGDWKEGTDTGLNIPSLASLWTPQDAGEQKSFGSRNSGTDAALLPSRSACGQTETGIPTVLSGVSHLNSCNLTEVQESTNRGAEAASVVPGSAAASVRPVERDIANPFEKAGGQTSTDVRDTADCRRRKIDEIAKMLSLAAEEFERHWDGAQGRLQPPSRGQVIARKQLQGEATLNQVVAESPMCFTKANLEARPSTQTSMVSHLASSVGVGVVPPVDAGRGGATADISVTPPCKGKAQHQTSQQYNESPNVPTYGELINSLHSSVLRGRSGAAGPAASPWGSLHDSFHLNSANADYPQSEKNPSPIRWDLTREGDSVALYSETFRIKPQPAGVGQETPMCEDASTLVTSTSKAFSKDVGNPANPAAHPYVRLPFVPHEAIKRTFDYKTALFCTLRDRSALETLGVMRALFAKRALDWIEVNKLLSACQRLVNYAFFALKWPHHFERPCRVSGRLGLIFLTFDAVVCTMELLGENMLAGAWWQKFTSAFNTEYHVRARGQHFPAVKGQAGLCNLLLSAVQIYKTGKRPPLTNIIVLKRLLFCSKWSPDIFRRSQWDPWRLDDKSCSGV